MNYGLMLEHHNESGADVTLATLPIIPDQVSAFGVVEVARNGEVIGFVEKPKETNSARPSIRTWSTSPWASTSSTPTCSCPN